MTIGIYAIINTVNRKMYVGKSRNIEARFWSHKNQLKKDVRCKDTNRYLFSSVKKYGIENFEFKILESFESISDAELSDKELFYMDLYNSCNKDHGYNLRRDSSTKTEVHEDTKELIRLNNLGERNPNFGKKWTDEQKLRASEITKRLLSEGVYDHLRTSEYKEKLSKFASELWKDEARKLRMAENVSLNRRVFGFRQYDKVTKELVNSWQSMSDIIKANPNYHDKAIYSVCNGWKKSYRGFVWEKFELIDTDRAIIPIS